MLHISLRKLTNKKTLENFGLCLLTVALLSCAAGGVKAETTTSFSSAPRVLQQALASHSNVDLYGTRNYEDKLSFSGGLFSGRASGIDQSTSTFGLSGGNSFNHSAELEDDTRVYALMLDGKYSFDNHFSDSLPLHPYLSSGVGVAVYDHGAAPTAANLGLQSGGTVPLFRVGAGLAYELGEQWNMSLDYKAGFSGGNAPLNTASASAIDMQSLNMGMHFRF